MPEQATLRRDNNFGLLRLLFASMVIFSHAPEILDGDRSRELLTRIFGTISFGGLGVDGFFIISGCLVTTSFLSSRSAFDFFQRRIFRIYPGFAVSFWVCLILVAPLAGAGLGVFSPSALIRNGLRTAALMEPTAPGVFPGMPYPALNGAMWTIAYEFRCYILVAILGGAGLLAGKGRYLLLAGAPALLVGAGFASERATHGVAATVFGTLTQNLHLIGMFGAGALYARFKREIPLAHGLAAAAAAALVVCLFFAHAAPIAVGLLGGYLIFWFALRCPVLRVSRFANRTDLSYGIYLYGWPIQSVIAFAADRTIGPWTLSAVTLILAAGAAALSWRFVERPALAIAHRASALGPRDAIHRLGAPSP